MASVLKNSLEGENYKTNDDFSYLTEQIKYEKDKVDLTLLDKNKYQKADQTQEQILKKHATLLAYDPKLSFVECTGSNSRYHISLLTMYLIQPTSFGLQLPKEIQNADVPNLLGYFCILRSEDFSLFSTFNEYSQLRLNEYMFFGDIYLGSCYKLFFLLLNTTKFGPFIFDTIRNSKKMNPNIWNIKEYIAPCIIILCLIIFMFTAMSLSIFLFSRLLFFILIITSFMAQIWNNITWPSLYFISLQLRKMFFPSLLVNVQLARFKKDGAQPKSFYKQIKALAFGMDKEDFRQNKQLESIKAP